MDPLTHPLVSRDPPRLACPSYQIHRRPSSTSHHQPCSGYRAHYAATFWRTRSLSFQDFHCASRISLPGLLLALLAVALSASHGMEMPPLLNPYRPPGVEMDATLWPQVGPRSSEQLYLLSRPVLGLMSRFVQSQSDCDEQTDFPKIWTFANLSLSEQSGTFHLLDLVLPPPCSPHAGKW